MMLEINGISKFFKGIHAIKNVSFNVKKGDIQAVIGPNGAGKTTMLNLISGFLEPSSGEVIFEGQSISGLAAYKIARLGIVRTFQNGSIVSDASVIDNVLIGAYRNTTTGFFSGGFLTGFARKEEREVRQRALEILRMVGLSEIADRNASGLPYGFQRLIEVARVLMAEPKMMLLDEPAAGLNDAESERLSRLIKQINQELNLTIIMVEHHMGLVMGVSDRIVVLNYGEKIAEGTPQEITQDPHVIEAYLGNEVTIDA